VHTGDQNPPLFDSVGYDAPTITSVGVMDGTVKTTVFMIDGKPNIASAFVYFWHDDVDPSTMLGVSDRWKVLLADGTQSADGCVAPPAPPGSPTLSPPPLPPAAPSPAVPQSVVVCARPDAVTVGYVTSAACEGMLASFPTYTYDAASLAIGYCSTEDNTQSIKLTVSAVACDTDAALRCLCPWLADEYVRCASAQNSTSTL